MKTGKAAGPGKRYSGWLRRRAAWLMVMSMMAVYFVLPARAEAESAGVPRIEGDVILAFKAKYNYYEPWELTGYTPGKITLVFDYSGCDRAAYEISQMQLLYGGEAYEIDSFEVVEGVNTILADPQNAYNYGLQSKLQEELGITEPWSMSAEDIAHLHDALAGMSLMLEVEYENGTTVREPVRVMFTTTDSVSQYGGSVDVAVIDLADSATETAAGSFISAGNAIAAGLTGTASNGIMMRYYVDIESDHDAYLPVTTLSGDARLTGVKVGSEPVYRTSANIEMNGGSEFETASDEITDVTSILTYTVEGGGEKILREPMDLAGLLQDGIYQVGDRRVTLADYCMEIGQGQWGMQYELQTDLLEENADKLWEVIRSGSVLDQIPAMDINGDPVETEGAVGCKFHIAFEIPDDQDSMADFIEALQESEDSKIRYELGQVRVIMENGLTYDYADTKIRKKPAYDDTDGDPEYDMCIKNSTSWPINSLIAIDYGNGNIEEIAWIEYNAYDYDTYDFIKEQAETCGVSLDGEETYLPDFERAEREMVMTRYHISETQGIDYQEGTSDDRRTILMRKSSRVIEQDQVTLPQDGAALDTDASYENGQVAFPVDALGGLEKGIAYNVSVQVQMNDLQYVRTGSAGRSSDSIQYRNGDLLRSYVHVLNYVGKLWYTEYKWGELVPASRPTVCRGLTYDKDTGTLSWERPEDEGLGVSEGSARTDSCIYVKSYTVNIYDENDDLVDSVVVPDDKNGTQSVELPLGRSRSADTYTVEIVATNALGDSGKAVIAIDRSASGGQDPDDTEKPDDTEDPGTPESPDTPQGGGTPESPDTPQGGGTPESPDAPQGGGTPENPAAPVSPTITPVKPAGTMSPPRMDDHTPIGLWLFLLCASGMGLEVLGMWKIDKLRKAEKRR